MCRIYHGIKNLHIDFVPPSLVVIKNEQFLQLASEIRDAPEFNPILTLHIRHTKKVCTQLFSRFSTPRSSVRFPIFIRHFFFYLEYGSFFKHTFDTQETTIKLFFRGFAFFFSLPIHWLWLTASVHCARICAMPPYETMTNTNATQWMPYTYRET